MDREIMGSRLKYLRNSIKLPQKNLAKLIGVTQSAINRYEHGVSDIPNHILLWYADYFDVSLDYIFGRTDQPQGKLYKFQPRNFMEDEKIRSFVEMCFEPGTAANSKLKEAVLRLLQEGET